MDTAVAGNFWQHQAEPNLGTFIGIVENIHYDFERQLMDLELNEYSRPRAGIAVGSATLL
ncbi:MAG: hypothetical protein NT083_06950 [Rhodocyclales bacterium]|nr:hypothetical protein [Rhodocyclales bacterium]